LADEFAIAARLYAEAVVKFTKTVRSEANFKELSKRAKKAQERAELARVAFEEHVFLHRCGLGS
jgi:hypothetical protein